MTTSATTVTVEVRRSQPLITWSQYSCPGNGCATRVLLMKCFASVNAAGIISSHETQYQQDTRCAVRRRPIEWKLRSLPATGSAIVFDPAIFFTLSGTPHW